MARTALTLQSIVRTGLHPVYTSANADGHNITNEGKKTVIHVKNAGVSSINVTIQTPNTVDSLAVSDRVVAVPSGEERMIGPFPVETYNQSDGTIYVDFSAVTSVTIAALKVS